MYMEGNPAASPVTELHRFTGCVTERRCSALKL